VVRLDKAELRRAMRARLEVVTVREREQAGVEALAQLRATGEIVRAHRFACYAALPEELPTWPLLEYLWSLGHPVYLPRVRGRRLEFAAVESRSTLEPGVLGILEPGRECVAAQLGEGDLVMVPGLAFDRNGRRLGRGGGFYDRSFPPRAPAPRLLGFGFACQLLDELPEEPHDRRLDGVLTEAGLVLAEVDSRSGRIR
jgi:5-formyltetrahydrofolate cyclo-ligase